MIRVSMSAAGVGTLAGQLRAAPIKNGAKMLRLVGHHTAVLDLRMKQNASGRPGPRAITGDFRRSITHEVKASVGGAEGVAGTSAPQARRLEYGFTGTDSLGRHYDQPPFPYARPAADQVEPEFVSDALRTFGDL